MTKIMILDDDLGMIRLLTTLFELDGYSVVGVSERDSFLSRASDEKPDLVIMDIFLKGEDSLGLLAQLRENPQLSETRVIMTSGMELSDKCKAAGCDAFLLKPFTPEQLAATIEEQLGGGGSRT